MVRSARGVPSDPSAVSAALKAPASIVLVPIAPVPKGVVSAVPATGPVPIAPAMGVPTASALMVPAAPVPLGPVPPALARNAVSRGDRARADVLMHAAVMAAAPSAPAPRRDVPRSARAVPRVARRSLRVAARPPAALIATALVRSIVRVGPADPASIPARLWPLRCRWVKRSASRPPLPKT
jgi:hypothetical protein